MAEVAISERGIRRPPQIAILLEWAQKRLLGPLWLQLLAPGLPHVAFEVVSHDLSEFSQLLVGKPFTVRSGVLRRAFN